ncbi:MAG TPA: glycosyltransferase family 39 protein [Phenylobacterium sp.]|uniref:ArnT family glycosyltransferase n=1 Tax=Phenylobacterium sp. TaxID=1871053 RepID=UPI002CD28657|nr:glycosyltransferase family 39 protein [Phenylobacterium sp.]HSV04551.1 glycosyltransferase family 39 protein [Phenylobacterium sp.]
MTLEGELARWSRGWRGPAVAAFIAFLAGLPGLIAVPPLDRDESRFAQATAQMLESRDFVVIRYQEQPRFKKPVGIHWLQAASVSLFSSPEARQIWAYRIPSLIGAMLAAAACAWGAAGFFGDEAGLLAGAMLGASFLLSTEAFIAKTDAVLCGATTLAMAALGRIYASARGGPPAGRAAAMAFWAGLGVATLVKGPVGPMVAALAVLALVVAERRAGWLARLDAYWGLVLFLIIVGPWAGAVTVATDGGFWSSAVAGDLAPKLAGGQETHGAPPGYHTLLAPILAFPMTLLLPAAAVTAWRRRGEPGVRFALAWLIPTWLVFEALPTKLVHYTLPAYGALAWLAGAALAQPLGARARWLGAALQALAGLILAAGVVYLMKLYGTGAEAPEAVLTAALLAAAGLVAAYLLVRRAPLKAAVSGLGLGLLGHAALAAGLAPRLQPLWLSERVEDAMARAQLLPSQGLADAPVTVAGYAEPSLVFELGTDTELGDAEDAAAAMVEHRPAVVEAREEPAFRKALAADHAAAIPVARIDGVDYSTGHKLSLRVYKAPDAPNGAEPGDSQP